MILPSSGSIFIAARMAAITLLVLFDHCRSIATLSISGSSMVLSCSAMAALLTRLSSLPTWSTTFAISGSAGAGSP